MNRAELENKVKTLELELSQAKEQLAALPNKWEPKGGCFGIGNDGLIHELASSYKESREFGIERETREQAVKAAKAMRTHNRLLAYVAEFAPDWEASWSNVEQVKFLVYFDNCKLAWFYSRALSDVSAGAVYMPLDVAIELVAKLNSGEVEL